MGLLDRFPVLRDAIRPRPTPNEERLWTFGDNPGMFQGGPGNIVPSWPRMTGYTQNYVGLYEAAGIPAVGAAIRLLGETVGMIPCVVYHDDEARSKAKDAWQYPLLHDMPTDGVSAFDFFCDVASSIEATGDAFIWKIKANRRLEQLVVVDPGEIEVTVENGQRRYWYWKDGQKRSVGAETILHIRGFTLAPGAPRGVSPITQYRNELSTAISTNEFEGRFFDNDASPGGAISVPGKLSRDQAEEMLGYWEDRHGGRANARRPALFTNGGTWTSVGISLADAQFIESKKFTVEEVARMFRISPTMLGAAIGSRPPPVADDFERFLKLDLAPRLRRIEMALKADPDLFPDATLFPEFLAESVLRADVKTRYEAYRLARQGGWMAPNEIRIKENLPPKPGGDDIQITPVGGAPNETGGTVDGSGSSTNEPVGASVNGKAGG